jgi:3-methylfumaryl-CoA hydratase
MSERYADWIGRTETSETEIGPARVAQLAVTLDMPKPAQPSVDRGDLLPPLWHWLGWTPDTPISGLGQDGHPARGGFLPPVPLERRMWAGGRLVFHAPIAIGTPLLRRSEIVAITEKTGSVGPMVFVTVRHEIEADGTPAITEEQDIVFVAMPDRFVPPPPISAPEAPVWEVAVPLTTARLFRFSAVTFNAHRIHYDFDYATHVEKYPGLVVHGPLQAILLMEAARAERGGAMPKAFRFRGVRPLFHFDTLRLCGMPVIQGTQALHTATGEDLVTMQAEVQW